MRENTDSKSSPPQHRPGDSPETRISEKLNSILILRAAKDLHPAYFALVMATGIVSISAFLLKMNTFAWTLLWINIGAYIILWILTILRLGWHFSNFRKDLTDHARGPGYFTIVAGTCVLGSQFVILARHLEIALGLWLLGSLIWIVLTYIFFTFVTIKEEKPSLEKGINGSWLITIVATQSVSILGVLVIPVINILKEILYFSMLAMFLIGCMLYILVITLIFYRFLFYKLTPEELTQPYWINMGAVAITTLAGATLMLNSSNFILLQQIMPFLKGFTLFFWAIGTWWIPLLFILGYWRHIYKKFSFKYDPQYWGMVFPLGMYTTCTYQLAKALSLEFLEWIPAYFIYIAIVAWLASFVLLIYDLIYNLMDSKIKGEVITWKENRIK